MNEVINKYPSLCYTCEHARKPASDENQNIGWVGCAQYTRLENKCYFLQEAKDTGEGWVDLRAGIFKPKSGMITNFCLLTKETTKCSAYQKITE